MANAELLSTLAQHPQQRAAVELLIEEAFNYQAPYHFSEDFYPLLAPENASHNHLILQGDILLGHIGVRLVDLAYGKQSVKAAFLGGLAMRPDYRGLGIFKAAFQQVLALYEKQVGLFILWSDQASLYAKFNFWQAGLVLQLGEKDNLPRALLQEGWRKYAPLDFADPIGQQLDKLYQAWANNFIHVHRTGPDWKTLAKIKSAQFLVHLAEPASPRSRSPRIPNLDAYCVIGKGFDLANVVHEVGGPAQTLSNFFKHWQSYKIWLPGSTTWQASFPAAKHIYLGLLRRGNLNLLRPLWAYLAREEQRKIEQIYQNGDDGQFWQTLFGPGQVGLLPPLFISGLDSI